MFVSFSGADLEVDEQISLPQCEIDFSFLSSYLPGDVVSNLNSAQPSTLAAFKRIRGTTPSSVRIVLETLAPRMNPDQ